MAGCDWALVIGGLANTATTDLNHYICTILKLYNSLIFSGCFYRRLLQDKFTNGDRWKGGGDGDRLKTGIGGNGEETVIGWKQGSVERDTGRQSSIEMGIGGNRDRWKRRSVGTGTGGNGDRWERGLVEMGIGGNRVQWNGKSVDTGIVEDRVR